MYHNETNDYWEVDGSNSENWYESEDYWEFDGPNSMSQYEQIKHNFGQREASDRSEDLSLQIRPTPSKPINRTT